VPTLKTPSCGPALQLLASVLLLSLSAHGAQRAKAPPGPTGIVSLEAKKQERHGEQYVAEGDVDIRYQDMRLRAGYVTYNSSTGDAAAREQVQFDYQNQHLEATQADVNIRNGHGLFTAVRGTITIERRTNPTLLVTPNPLYFQAREVERVDQRTYLIRHAWMTVCLPDRPTWKFYAPHARLKVGDEVALVNANFRLLRIPLLYLPYADLPAARTVRKSGILLPIVEDSSNKGFVLGDALYWAPTPWFDTTLGAEFLSRRGSSERAQLRARPGENVSFSYDYYGVIDRGLPGANGALVPQGGHQQTVELQAILPHGWRAVADVNTLSSLTFRLAFAETFGEAANSDVRSAAFLSNNFDGFTLDFAGLTDQSFLTVQPVETSVILRSAPEARFGSVEQAPWERLPIYFGFSAYTGAVHRTDPSGVVTPAAVERSEIAPRVALPLHLGSWLGVTTTATFRSTFYGAQLQNGMVLDRSFLRNTGEFSVDIHPPSFERIFENPNTGTKWKHVIEPELTYQYVNGVQDFSRFIRYDEDDTLTDTNEIEYGITQRLYRKTSDGQAEEFLSWNVMQKHYFDPTFGGALVPGARNVFQALDSITPFAFADGPRNWSPLVSDVKFTPGGRYDGEFILNYDPQKTKITSTGVLINVKPYRQFFATVADFSTQSDPALQPLSNQIRALLGYGQLNRKGFNVSGGVSYDLHRQSLQSELMQVSYNGGCCGIAFEYQRLVLFPVRTENEFRASLMIANLGNFGNLRREEKVF
jgi:LPS-assembly protein